MNNKYPVRKKLENNRKSAAIKAVKALDELGEALRLEGNNYGSERIRIFSSAITKWGECE